MKHEGYKIGIEMVLQRGKGETVGFLKIMHMEWTIVHSITIVHSQL